jgi:hypothetical protein
LSDLCSSLLWGNKGVPSRNLKCGFMKIIKKNQKLLTKH